MERRLDPRAEIVARVECRVGARSETVIAYDLSSDGCLLQCPLGFVEPGDEIDMRFQQGVLVQGRIIWRKNLNAGVLFASQVPRSLIAALTLPELDAANLGQKREAMSPPALSDQMHWLVRN